MGLRVSSRGLDAEHLSSMKYLALLNKDGGTLKGMDPKVVSDELTSRFEAGGHSIATLIICGSELEEVLADFVANDDYEALLIGGGDGTVSAAASALANTPKKLTVLPLGTMNLFARSLSIPLDFARASIALSAGVTAKVDMASANGRIFIHHFSVGMHPKAMRLRNKSSYSTRYGKMFASLKAIFSIVSQPPAFDVRSSIDDEAEAYLRLSAISVSNNAFDDAHLPYADTLTEAELGVYFADKLAPATALKLCIDIFAGGWLSNPAVSQHTAKQVRFKFPKLWRHARASIDGEIIPLEAEVMIKTHPKALNVIIPDRPGATQ